LHLYLEVVQNILRSFKGNVALVRLFSRLVAREKNAVHRLHLGERFQMSRSLIKLPRRSFLKFLSQKFGGKTEGKFGRSELHWGILLRAIIFFSFFAARPCRG
jgi:hypothetical protein